MQGWGEGPQDVPPLETRPASSLRPCPGKNTSSEGPRAVLHQSKVSQLGCSPQPPPRATFLGQAPWLGRAGLPSSLETWDRTAGASPQKGQPENFSPELMTKHADTDTSLQGEPPRGSSAWCTVQQNTSHGTAVMRFAQAGAEAEEPHQLCHASSCLIAASQPLIPTAARASWTTAGWQPGATLQHNHPWDGGFCPDSHPAPKGFLFLLPCHIPSNPTAVPCSLWSLGTARSPPSQLPLPSMIPHAQALNCFLVAQPIHMLHGHRAC